MSGPFSFNNRPARPASIPIPPSSRRSGNIEDILPTLSPASQTRAAGSPLRSQQRSAGSPTSPAPARSLYSGLEGTRPVTARHPSTSISPGTTRHALGGGTGPAWGPRSASSSVGATSHDSSVSLPRSVSGFEPRVIRGNIERTGTADQLPSGLRRDSTSMSPSRARRPSTSAANPASVLRSPATSLRPTPASSSNTVPALVQGPAASATAPATFARPSYLDYSALRNFIQTDASPALPPSRYGVDNSSPSTSLLRREATPFTDSDDDSESSIGVAGRGFLRTRDSERGRGRERASAYAAAASFVNPNPTLRLPTRWNEQDRNSSLTVSGDGRELHFHGSC